MLSYATGGVACGQTAEGDRIIDGNTVLPVEVVNPLRVVAPVFKVFADAEGADHLADAVLQGRYRFPGPLPFSSPDDPSGRG